MTKLGNSLSHTGHRPRRSLPRIGITMGDPAGIATAPINKRALFLGGYSFPGHTEFLASLTSTEEYAMAFVAANLRIVLLSTHVPLAEAIRMVERDRIIRIIRLAHRELQRWGIDRPR